MKKLFALCLAAALLLSGCAAAAPVTESADSVETDFSLPEELFTKRDLETDYDPASAVAVTLNGGSAVCGDPSVDIQGGSVTLRGAGTYLIRGTLNNGSLTVNAGESDKLHLVLDGASIHCENSAALFIQSAGKVVVTLAEGTENRLSNGGSFEGAADEKIDAAVFSKEDLSFNGSGSLEISSPAGHGVCCKDDLVFAGGEVTVTAAGHGLEANDSVRIQNASLDLTAGKDGIHAENDEDASLGYLYLSNAELTVDAQGDGLSAGAALWIEGGTLHVSSGGGSAEAEPHTSDFFGGRGGFGMREETSALETEDSVSAKALKAEGLVYISGGSFTLDAADDAVHANGSILVKGGDFVIDTGDDGFHADESLTISGGVIDIRQCYEGLEALELTVSGGETAIVAQDDGLNAAGGQDQSGFGGPRGNDRFGGPGRGQPMGGGIGPGDAGADSEAGITVSGGVLNVQASGDGLDSNGSLRIEGGQLTVCGPSQGDTATLDYGTTGAITGGVFLGSGGSSMAQSFSSSEQGVIAVRAGEQSAGTKVQLADSQGKVLLSFTPPLPFSVVILSSPELVPGESYALTIGSQSENFTAS